MGRSGRRVCVPPSKPCSWPCEHGGTCLGRSNVKQRVVVCCWGVSWSFGSLATHGNPVGRNNGDVNGRYECAIFWPFLAVGCLFVRVGCLLCVQTWRMLQSHCVVVYGALKHGL